MKQCCISYYALPAVMMVQESRWEKELMEVCDGKWITVSSSEGESWATVSDREQTGDFE